MTTNVIQLLAPCPACKGEGELPIAPSLDMYFPHVRCTLCRGRKRVPPIRRTEYLKRSAVQKSLQSSMLQDKGIARMGWDHLQDAERYLSSHLIADRRMRMEACPRCNAPYVVSIGCPCHSYLPSK